MQKKKHPEYQYLDLLREIMEEGSDKPLFFTPEVLEEYKKKGENPPFIRSVFGRQMRFDLSGDKFPLLTTKRVFTRGVFVELLWFLSGSSNIKPLIDANVHIWDDWAWKRYHKAALVSRGRMRDMTQEEFVAKLLAEKSNSAFVKKWGDLVTIYGRMWRRWPASDGSVIDQLGWVIKGLKDKPYRKSYVVSAWNPDFIYAMASPGNANEVPPFCHTMYQFAVVDGKLNLGLYQRSGDFFLGVPFNIASYAMLLLMVSQVSGIPPGEFVHFLGDAHIYSNHFEAVAEQLKRDPKDFPSVRLNKKIKDIDGFRLEDIKIEGYEPHPTIKAEIANIGGF